MADFAYHTDSRLRVNQMRWGVIFSGGEGGGLANRIDPREVQVAAPSITAAIVVFLDAHKDIRSPDITEVKLLGRVIV